MTAYESPISILCYAGHPLAGFLRFLQLLGTHPWQERPLVIGSAQELPPAQRSTLANLFSAGRQAGTLPAVVLATAKDPQGTAWTQRGPSGDVWRRLVLLARRGLQALQVGPRVLGFNPTPQGPLGQDTCRGCLAVLGCGSASFPSVGAAHHAVGPLRVDGVWAGMTGDADGADGLSLDIWGGALAPFGQGCPHQWA